MKPQYFVSCTPETGDYVGDYLGQPAATRWRVIGHRCGTGGGPFQWFHLYYRCPATNTCAGLNATEKMASRSPALNYPEYVASKGLDGELEESPADLDYEDDEERSFLMRKEMKTPPRCCENLPDGYKCQIDCQQRQQNGETALAVDTGFYFDFSVDPETGMPGGCSAFDPLKTITLEDGERMSDVVNCPVNKYAPEGEALSSIVEDFADDTDRWIQDYMTAFDKMSTNGNENLVAGPTKWFDARCSYGRVRKGLRAWHCK